MNQPFMYYWMEQAVRQVAEFKENTLRRLCCEAWGCHADDVICMAPNHKLELVTESENKEFEIVKIDGVSYGYFMSYFDPIRMFHVIEFKQSYFGVSNAPKYQETDTDSKPQT